ncbi:SRPBCC family protein [Bacteriovorax sp. PP10]|uniref:SRPBCC family protein n=1 Tax=Bacteriovorax antarcticus TaxID=3088717 RepID=A0ABU5VW27_9BACT|nr:SRPBCC family protein [Bacteriovorax sp. PP10]MEA9357265.1 SRPBCC family protein [Bacteriovorax sp. PP10]
MNTNPKLDLVLNKILDITPEQAWKGWTTPELFGEWFCPKPWKVVEARLDPRPGGEFFTMMQSPEGDKFPNTGCILEAIPGKKLVWTSALLEGFRPSENKDMSFTAVILLEPYGKNQTKYIAIGMHGNELDRKKHEDMGFEQGWGICADQLEAMMKSL